MPTAVFCTLPTTVDFTSPTCSARDSPTVSLRKRSTKDVSVPRPIISAPTLAPSAEAAAACSTPCSGLWLPERRNPVQPSSEVTSAPISAAPERCPPMPETGDAPASLPPRLSKRPPACITGAISPSIAKPTPPTVTDLLRCVRSRALPSTVSEAFSPTCSTRWRPMLALWSLRTFVVWSF